MKMLIQKVNIYNLFSQAEKNVNNIMFDNSVQVTRGFKEPVIAHLVFNLTSKVDRKWGCYNIILKVGHQKIISTQISEQQILM
jgi:hypothetical protein